AVEQASAKLSAEATEDAEKASASGEVQATKGSLRDRLADPPSNLKNPEAHHDLPQAPRFQEQWDRAGLDVNDPANGRWVEGGPQGNHQKWSYQFNKEW